MNKNAWILLVLWGSLLAQPLEHWVGQWDGLRAQAQDASRQVAILEVELRELTQDIEQLREQNAWFTEVRLQAKYRKAQDLSRQLDEVNLKKHDIDQKLTRTHLAYLSELERALGREKGKLNALTAGSSLHVQTQKRLTSLLEKQHLLSLEYQQWFNVQKLNLGQRVAGPQDDPDLQKAAWFDVRKEVVASMGRLESELKRIDRQRFLNREVRAFFAEESFFNEAGFMGRPQRGELRGTTERALTQGETPENGSSPNVSSEQANEMSSPSGVEPGPVPQSGELASGTGAAETMDNLDTSPEVSPALSALPSPGSEAPLEHSASLNGLAIDRDMLSLSVKNYGSMAHANWEKVKFSSLVEKRQWLEQQLHLHQRHLKEIDGQIEHFTSLP